MALAIDFLRVSRHLSAAIRSSFPIFMIFANLLTSMAMLLPEPQPNQAEKPPSYQELKAELLATEQKFRQLLEYMPASMAMVDCQMNYLAVSRRWQQNFGFCHSELIGQNHYQVFPPLDENVQTIYQSCIATGVAASYQEPRLKNNGQTDWLSWQIQPWYNNEGKVGGLILSVEPIEAIADCQNLVEELEVRRQSEFLHQFATDQAADAIFWIKSNGQLSYANEAASHLLGYRKEELLNLTIDEIDPGFSPPIWSQHWQAFQQSHPLTFESTYRTNQGTTIFVEVRVNYLAFQGEEYYCAFVRDISDRKQAAQALQETNEQLHAVLDAVPGLVSWVGADLRYLGVNQHLANAFNLPSHSFIGQKIGFMENSSKFYDLVPEFFATSESTISTEMNIPFQQEYRNYLIVGQKYNQGQKAVFVGLDISERKRMEADLRQSESQTRQQAIELEKTLEELHRTQTQLIYMEKMFSLGQVVAGLAHEINNSIGFIYGNIGYARQYFEDIIELVKIYQKKTSPSDPDIQEMLEQIDFSFITQDFANILSSMQLGADRIRQVVLSLRTFSQVDQSQKKAFDIHEGIDSTLLLLQNRLQAKAGRPGIKVIKEYGDLPRIECYPGQLNQVFINLLHNAIDALEQKYRKNPDKTNLPDSIIRVKTEILFEETLPQIGATGAVGHDYLAPIAAESTVNKFAVIRIYDNGLGMSEEVQKKLYEPGFSTKPQGKGTGLGLKISRHIIVDKHKGDLSFYSKQGEETEFVIKIPFEQN